MGKLLFIISLGLGLNLLQGCAGRRDTFSALHPSKLENPEIFVCSCFCYFRGKDGAFSREFIDSAETSLDTVWNIHNRNCKSLNGWKDGYELQKSLSTKESPGDNFTKATKDNSCAAFVRRDP